MDNWIRVEDSIPLPDAYEMSAWVIGWDGSEWHKCYYSHRYQEWLTDTELVVHDITHWMPSPNGPSGN